MKLYDTQDFVMIDENHLNLIYSLILCKKPKKILEIGIGSGAATNKIISACEYNKIKLDLTCVDNFCDWNGRVPTVLEGCMEKIKQITFIKSNEHDFIVSHNEKYDFILSDADHSNTQRWVDKTYNLLNPSGLLIYHDITNVDYPNLYDIVHFVRDNKIQHMLFNTSSLISERCERGILVIQKT